MKFLRWTGGTPSRSEKAAQGNAFYQTRDGKRRW
jgi:hypothetical protein